MTYRLLRSRSHPLDSWMLSELPSEPTSPAHRPNHGPVEGTHRRRTERPTARVDDRQKANTPARHVLADDPSDDDKAWAQGRGSGRRRRLGEDPLHSVPDSSAVSESPVRGGGLSTTSPRTFSGIDGGPREGNRADVGDRLPPRDGHRVRRPGGGGNWAEGVPGMTMETGWGLSTKSADGGEEGVGNGPVLESSTQSAGTIRSNMGAR